MTDGMTNRIIAIRRQRGVVVLPFILGVSTFLVVMGTIVESTVLLHARNRLFNDAETALLAAANLYDAESGNEGNLEGIIQSEFSNHNFLDAASTSLDLSQLGDQILILNTTKSIPFLFLPGDISVTAQIAATVPQPAGEITGAAPLGMQWPPGGFTPGTSYVLKEGPGDGTTGNFNALDMNGGGGGAPEFEDDLTNGYDGTIQIGQDIEPQTGGMSNATRDAINARLATPSTDDDIIIVVITTDEWGPGVSTPITVTGFAAFRVTDVVETGHGVGTITGTFMEYKLSAEPASSACNCDYGVYTRPKLIFF